MKTFNTAGPCIPAIHYMADLTKRVQAIKAMIDAGKYFRIARGHQYGKTTTLTALSMYLKADYVFLMLDFQSFGAGGFSDEGQFIKTFTRIVHKKISRLSDIGTDVCGIWKTLSDRSPESLRLDELQDAIEKLCSSSKLPVILVIDEVDHASDYQVFNSFLGMLRGAYILHAQDPSCPALQSVILAGVTDITAMHQKIRADHAHTLNSPWNIAVPFTVRMSLDTDDISGMLTEYEEDHRTGMDIRDIASLIYDYTDGYPYLVSRICQYLDETLPYDEKFLSYGKPWSREGIAEAVRVIHSEDNMLFQSVMSKVQNSETLRNFIQAILFNGKEIAFDYDSPVLRDAEMYGLIKNRHNTVQIANRIFETRLYDHFLNAAQLSDMLTNPLQLTDKKSFIKGSELDVERILERFTVIYHDTYNDEEQKITEAEGRRRFLLFIRPIINGTGNYYIESHTRDNKRTDLIIDYLGHQYIIEMKIWHGNSYHSRGESQLHDYLNYYHLDKGYMLSFCFNKSKKIGVQTLHLKGKELVEAIV